MQAPRGLTASGALLIIEVGACYRASFKSKWEHTAFGEVGNSLLTLLYSIT